MDNGLFRLNLGWASSGVGFSDGASLRHAAGAALGCVRSTWSVRGGNDAHDHAAGAGSGAVDDRRVEGDEVYADQTVYGALMLTFRHQLTRLDDGGTRVTHTLEISGPGADEVGPDLGPQISGDFPVTMGELIVASEARTVAGMSR